MPDIYAPSSVEPYQTPSLQARISNAINALRGKFPAPQSPAPQPKTAPEVPAGTLAADDTPAGRGLPDATYISPYMRSWDELFKFGVSRPRRYADYELFDQGVVAAMLDAVVDSCLVSDDSEILGFKIQAKSKYQTILDRLVKDLNLNFDIRFILRETLKYGDCFIAPVFSENWDIVDYDNPPPGQIWKFTDEHLRLLTGTELLPLGKNGEKVPVPLGFQQKNDSMVTVAGWYPWEMLHLRYMPGKRARYSLKSFIEDIRPDLYKIKMVEEALVIHRLTRAAPRNVHTLDVTGKSTEEAKEALKQYISDLTQKKLTNNQYVRDTIAVDEDIFVGNIMRQGGDGKYYESLNKVETIDPRNAGLQKLGDLEYLQKKIFSRIPSEIVGVLPDRNDITTQDIAASRLYMYLQTLLEKQLLRPLFDLQLRLRGYVPTEEDYQIIFPTVQMRTSWRFGDASFRISMSEANEIESGTNNRKNIAMQKHGWTEGEWEEHEKEWDKEQKTFGQMPNATKPSLIRQGQKGSSPESLDTPPESILEQAKQQYAESMLPVLQELRELKQELNSLKQQPQPQQPNVTVNVPERPINITVPEQRVEVHPTQVTVEPAQVNLTLPEQQAPVVNVAPSHVNVNVPEQVPPTINVTPEVKVENIVPEQPTPVVHNTLNIPEQSAHITVNVPEQPTPIVNVAPSQVSVNVPESPAPIVQNTVNLPEQQAPTINVSPTPVTVNPAMVSVNVPETPAPVVVNEVKIPDPVTPQVIVNVPEQQAPIVNVAPAEVKIENVIPEQPTPQVNVTLPEQVVPTVNVNVPQDAIKVDVSVDARVDLPDEEIVEFTREPATGKVVGAKKTRKYTRRKKKVELEQTEAPNTDSPIDNSTDSSQNS